MQRALLQHEAPGAATGALLRRWLAERIAVNPAYSLRAMARQLGLSPGYLSQVMNGRKGLASVRAVQIAQTLRMSDEDTRSLLLSAALGKVGAVLDSTEAHEFRSLEVEQFRALGHWYHVAILDLAETKGFRSQPAWIAKRLRISPLQAAEALERLQTLGLLVKKEGAWRKSEARLKIVATSSRSAIREYHKQMITKALEALDDATPEAFARRSVTGITMSVDPTKLPQAYEMIDRFRRRLERFLGEGKASEVYQLNVQLFNLSHELKNRTDS